MKSLTPHVSGSLALLPSSPGHPHCTAICICAHACAQSLEIARLSVSTHRCPSPCFYLVWSWFYFYWCSTVPFSMSTLWCAKPLTRNWMLSWFTLCFGTIMNYASLKKNHFLFWRIIMYRISSFIKEVSLGMKIMSSWYSWSVLSSAVLGFCGLTVSDCGMCKQYKLHLKQYF